MATIVTRAGKGAALTHQEVDANFTGLNTELGQKEVASNKGVANGYASLDAAGKVPSAQLPSYVDDVVEVANFASLPGTGETGKIYVTIDTNKTYRWSGSAYIEISASPGSTDSLAEGSTNLYFTQARARASVSASGSLSYNSTTGVFSFSDAVISVAGRTGAVTLTSSDVGLGNVENKSSATIRGELTSSNVTTALGFTPYNATNPSGYISGNQTITVSGDASGSGATSIALTLANSGVTAGSYGSSSAVPVITVDAKGRVTAVSTSSISGSLTFTGDVTGSGSTGSSTTLTLANSGVAAGTYTKVTVDAKGRVTTGASLASGDLPTYTGTITSSQVTTALGYTPYNSTNPSNFITGSASITGNAATATNILNTGTVTLASATESNAITVTAPSYTTNQPVKLLNFAWYGNDFSIGNIRSGDVASNGFGVFYTANGGSRTEIARFGTSGSFNAIGAITQNGSQVLHANNYSSYALPLSGGTVTGTALQVGTALAYNNDGGWNANIVAAGSAHARFRLRATSFAGSGDRETYLWLDNSVSPSTGIYSNASTFNFNGSVNTVQVGGNTTLHAANYSSYALPLSGGTVTGGTTFSNVVYFGTDIQLTRSDTSPALLFTSQNQWRWIYNGGGNYWQANIAIVSGGGNISINGNAALHAGNYSSYALPLSGGTMSGAILLGSTVAIRDASGEWILGKNTAEIAFGSTAVTNGIAFNSASNSTFTYRGQQIIHAGNYSSYSLPLSGGTLSGAIRAPSITAGGGTNTDAQFGVAGTAHLDGTVYFGGSVGNVSSWSSRQTSSSGTQTLSLSRFIVDRQGYGSQSLIDAQNGLITLGQPTRIEGGIRQGNNLARPLAQWSASGGSSGMVIFKLPGGSGNYGMVHMVFDIYEYDSPTVSTVIVGGHNWSGTWYNFGANVVGQCAKEVRVGFKDGQYCVVFGTSSSSWSYGTIVLRKIHNGAFYDNLIDMGAAFTASQTTTESFSAISGDLRALRTPSSFNAGGAITQAGNQVLHAGNYTSYSPSLTGSGASGTWGISVTGNAATASNISNTGTVTLATATESNAITITAPSYSTDTPVKLLNFDWYGNTFSLGNIRSGTSTSNGFGVYYTASGGSRTEVARFSTGGNFTATGNVTAYSDERVKANWRQLDDRFLVKLSSVKSGIYDRTDAEITQVGVSAQSLRDVLPHAVIESDEGDLSVAYGNAALVSAVELAKELVALKHKVAELEARVH